MSVSFSSSMPSVPTPLTALPRVLLVEPRLEVARALLSELCNAGIECRFSPDASSALEAARLAEPHLIVFGAAPSLESQNAAIVLHQQIKAPLIVLCHDASERYKWNDFPVEASDFLMPTSVSKLVHDVEQHLSHACKGKALFAAETAASRACPPPGWGACRDCGYMGPRAKFDCPDRRVSHSLRCPACKHSDHVEFTIA